MVFRPAPDPHQLLPPLLACLPTAFASSRPAPTLLPLLSPILRQRVQLLSTTTTSAGSWLPLLCWNSESAPKLSDIIADGTFEAHPVSGDIEFKDVGVTMYRRIDEETFQARHMLEDLRLEVLHLWCVGDQEGGGDGWRVTELKPLESDSNHEAAQWHDSMPGAEEAFTAAIKEPVLTKSTTNPKSTILTPPISGDDDKDDADDAYWGRYDDTPARTPGAKRSPAPQASRTSELQMTSDEQYYAQYNDIQPALDEDDSSAERMEDGDSTLDGHAYISAIPNNEVERTRDCHRRDELPLNQPRPASSSSSASESNPVRNLESRATQQSQSEFGIKQHIGTSIKSLYRLVRASGMDREEFERLVRTELDVLGLMDDDVA